MGSQDPLGASLHPFLPGESGAQRLTSVGPRVDGGMAFARCLEGTRPGAGRTQPLRSSQLRPAAPEDATASRRGARPARGGHTRSLLARGERCRVLARQPGFPRAAFYSYAYPEPAGLRERAATPGAHLDATPDEFILPYDRVRTAVDPDAWLLDFLSTICAAAAASANDRSRSWPKSTAK